VGNNAGHLGINTFPNLSADIFIMANLQLDTSTKPLWKDGPFLIYLSASFFILFFSLPAIHYWSAPWKQISITTAGLIPFLIICLQQTPKWIRQKTLPNEILLILVIVLLGGVNVLFSDTPSKSVTGMGLFLVTGLLGWGAGLYALNTKTRQTVFVYFCVFCLILSCLYGIYQWITSPGGLVVLYMLNPIPAGTILLLLSAGPLFFLTQSKISTRGRAASIIPAAFLLLGLFMLILMGKKGALFSALAMVLFSLWFSGRKIWVGLIVLTLTLFVGVGYQFKDRLSQETYKKITNTDSFHVRMEFLNLAYVLFKDNPAWGIGFNASLKKYITPEYPTRFFPKKWDREFFELANQVYTFDNMILCFIAEMGGLLSAAYLAMLWLVLRRFFVGREGTVIFRKDMLFILVPLIGFFIHSLMFDSLKYPPLNWMFHSLLALAANFQNNLDD